MTTAPPQNKTGRAFARPATHRDSTLPVHRVKALQPRGLTHWLDYLGRLAERAKTDPAAVREVLIWSRRIQLGTGEDVPGVLARSGGQQ